MKVAVVGGRGYYGERIVGALDRLDGVEVTVAGRSGPVVFDLADPSTHGALDGFDVVVDAADTVGARPDAAAIRIVERGGIWLEVSADRAVNERLLALTPPGPGALVVGVGIFPGLSTALAARAAAGLSDPSVELGVRLSPLSGAGRGNCALMQRMLETPGSRVVDGRLVETPAVFAAATLPFPSGDHAAAGVGLPDVALIHRATGAGQVTTRMALTPAVLRFGFSIAATLMRIAGPLRRPLSWLSERSLVVLRAGLLRRVSSRVELVAVASNAAGVAAAIICLRDGSRPAPGVHTAPDAFGADALLAAFARP